LRSYALYAFPSMSSNSGDVARQPDLLSPDDPNSAADDLSDVGSFSRTVPDINDDDDELDSSPPPGDYADSDEAARVNLDRPKTPPGIVVNHSTNNPDDRLSVHVRGTRTSWALLTI
jgi:hypothetical protein